MTEALSLMYGIDLPARSIIGIPAEQDRTLFLVGTLSLKQDNQICLLEVDDDWLQITKRSFNHPDGEIWYIASSSVDSNVFATCYVSYESSLIELAQYTSPLENGRCISAEFDPSGNKMAIAANKSVSLADVSNSLKIENFTSFDNKAPISVSVWNPHSNGSTLAVAYDTSVKGVDVRSLQEAFYIKDVNPPRIRNLDFNPNMQHIIATCGDDFRVALWDLRKVALPVKVLQDHSHWVWCVKFNPIHDQLLLSAGSDARLFLNSLESLSSESIHSFALVPDDSYSSPENVLGDERLEKMEEHEESVYSCAWAGNDPWIFASVSFDGRVIVSKVKRHHKYAILRL